MENENTYQCTSCANRGTPICHVCVTLSSPSGRIRRPSEYVEFARGEDKLRAHLLSCLLTQASLPVSFVLEYNREIERNRESEGR